MAEKAKKGAWGVNWEEAWERFRVPIGLGFAGLILVGIGTLTIMIFNRQEPEIEIIPLEESFQASSMFIDLEGAVEKPGLYELPSDSRVNDLLIKAGGLAAEADRDWFQKNINLAQKLTDGIKIYIPFQGETDLGQVAGGKTSPTGLININTALASELDTLWGIGSARAQDIIKNRPYQAVEDLLTKKVIPSNVFEKNKDQITVY